MTQPGERGDDVETTPALPPRVELRGVGKRYGRSGEREILRGIDWSLEPGGRVGLIGLNGAGKSTLARILVGLSVPDAGEVRIDGAKVWSDGMQSRGARPEHDPAGAYLGRFGRRRGRPENGAAVGLRGMERGLPGADGGLQLVLQEPGAAAHPALTVTEALLETLRAHAPKSAPASEAVAAETRIAEILRVIGLQHRAFAFPGQLSGGELRRLGVARALLARPRLLVLDEPTAGLDAALKTSLIHSITEACPSSTTVVWISHDLEVLRCTCERVAVLHEGALVEQLDIAQLRPGMPRHPLTRRLVDAWEALASESPLEGW